MSAPFPSRPASVDGIHFVQKRDLNPLRHRPHKFAIYFFNALRATALFRIWHMLLFLGGWSTMVVVVSDKTEADLGIPTIMITVLGVLLGLTLSYRTSSAYERYQEGRRMWAQIILTSRNWARTVWYHCPDSLETEPLTDPQARARDEARAIIEKKTIVQLALAFAVSVKHYLRGEEGIYYEDLYHLVNFIPSIDLPSGMAMGNANMQSDLPSFSATRPLHTRSLSGLSKEPTFVTPEAPPFLRPADDPPEFDWSSLFRFHKKNKVADEEKARQAQRTETIPMPFSCNNIPLEITMFMSSWVATMEKRKVIGVPTINQLYFCLNQLNEALATLERILTTPIPWSFNAHIWEISWIYCLALPFQLYGGGFGYISIPATVIVGYIIIGYASIAEEIEQPFGYDRNDLNLSYFCRHIIARELDAITARPLVDPDEYVFTSLNRPLGDCEPSADRLAEKSVEVIRSRLAVTGLVGSRTTAKTRMQYPETELGMSTPPGTPRSESRASFSYPPRSSPLARTPPMSPRPSADART